MSSRGVGRVVVALVLLAVAACGAPARESGPVTLRWYVGPDRADVTELAQRCSAASQGAYTISVVHLPADVDERHATVVRRLAAHDPDIDLLSVDASFTAELAAAQYLAPIPEDLKEPFAKDVLPGALQAASSDGALVVAPWWSDPYLLWYRGNTAERAGLDTSKPVEWADLLAGAQRLGGTVQIDDSDGQGLASWVDALVNEAGGTLLSGSGRTPTIGLDTDAGRSAAGIVSTYASLGIGPGPSDDAVARFAADPNGFLVAPASVVTDPALRGVVADIAWTSYPATDGTSTAPLTGVGLGVPLYARHSQQSYDAISCLQSDASLEQLMTSSGHASAKSSTFDAASVKAGYPLLDVVRKAVATARALPSTPYWQRVRAGLDETWLPVSSVTVAKTPARSQRTVRALVRGELP